MKRRFAHWLPPVLGVAGAALVAVLWTRTFGPTFRAAVGMLVLGILGTVAVAAYRLLVSPQRWSKAAGAVMAALFLALLATTVTQGLRYAAVSAEPGQLHVPENRAAGSPRALRLVYLRFRSAAPRPRAPIVFLAGGPGLSGIDSALYRLPVVQEIRKTADVIALDQRGTGRFNDPPLLACRLDSREANGLALALDQPLGKDALVAASRRRAQRCAADWKARGYDLSAYNTGESAADLEDLRRHLGAEKISLWAVSYGTHVALAYLKRFPGRVERAVLHGAEGPDQTIKLPGNVQKALEDFSRRANRPGTRGTGRDPDFLALAARVLSALEQGPVRVPLPDEPGRTVTLGKLDLQLWTWESLGTREARRTLPEGYGEFARGDYRRLARWSAAFRRDADVPLIAWLMDCASGASAERLRRIREESRATLLGSAADSALPDICEGLPAVDLGPAFRAPTRSGIPVLFVSGSLDVRTPASNAEELAGGFARSQHLILEGATHWDLIGGAPEMPAILRDFFAGRPLRTQRLALPGFAGE